MYFFILKKDPYCIIHIAGQKFRSKTHNGGGTKPQWADSFTFQGSATELKVEVYDDDIGKDDFYGEGFLDLSKWLANPNKAETGVVEIYDKKKKRTGRVLISI